MKLTQMSAWFNIISIIKIHNGKNKKTIDMKVTHGDYSNDSKI
jgi:hypothetical protein